MKSTWERAKAEEYVMRGLTVTESEGIAVNEKLYVDRTKDRTLLTFQEAFVPQRFYLFLSSWLQAASSNPELDSVVLRTKDRIGHRLVSYSYYS